MSLHQQIQAYIDELQQLLTLSDEQTLLDTARAQWGEKDVRYEVLEQFVENNSRFNKPSAPPVKSRSSSELELQNKPVQRFEQD